MSRRYPFWVAWIVLACAGAIGLYARFRSLGAGPLAVDEYYFLTSVESIVRTGVPVPPGGGYYVRGILLQYLTALSVALFESPELAVRLPAAILGFLAAGVASLYGSKVGGRWLGGTLAVTILVSSWCVEFSRFGRMYSAAQLLTLLFLLSLYPVVSGKAGSTRRYLPHVLLLLMVATHQLGLLLAPFVALPLLLSDRNHRLGGRRGAATYAVATLVAYSVVLAFRFTSFRTLGVSDALPANAGPDLARLPGLLRGSAFPFWSVSHSDTGNVAFVMAVVASVALILSAFRLLTRKVRTPEVVAGIAVAAAALHQFVVVFALFALLVIRYRVVQDRLRHKRAFRLAATAALFACGWVAYAAWLMFGAETTGWIAAAGAGSSAGAIRGAFFGWPDFYYPVLVPWLEEMPVLLILLTGGVLYQIALFLRKPWTEIALSPAAVVLSIAILFGTLDSLYDTTRYMFFIYPVALAALFWSVFDLVDRTMGYRTAAGNAPTAPVIIAPVICLLLFGISEDFNPRHLSQVASPEVRFRTGAFEDRQLTWYPRADYETPARVVASRVAPDDRVLLMDVPPTSYYLGVDHAVYIERADPRYQMVSRKGGTQDFWSGRRLLGTPAEVEDFLRSARRAWIVRHASSGVEMPFDAAADVQRVDVSRDGRIEVLLLNPTDQVDGFRLDR